MKTGKLILLVGSSSSGKSSLLEAFQNFMVNEKNTIFYNYGLDKMLSLFPSSILPVNFNNPSECTKPLMQCDMRIIDGIPYPYFIWKKPLHDYFHIQLTVIKNMINQGLNIIADMVVWDEIMSLAIQEVFSTSPYCSVKTFARPNILKEREIKRNNRMENFCYSSSNYSDKNFICDFELDTSDHKPEELALKLYDICY